MFGEMRKHGVRADRAAYNALINACAEAGDAARAEGALGQMTRAGLTPDVISYTSLIKACAATGGEGAARADEIFNEMQQRTNHVSTFTPPSERTFRHLMAVHLAANSTGRVLALLGELRAHGLAPSATHYSLALRACALPGVCALPESLLRATALYEQMRADGLRLDTHGLLALDRLCRQHKRHELAQRVRRERSMPHPDVGGPRRRRPKPRRQPGRFSVPTFTRAWPS